ncbi:hypothetical protein EI555_014214, partial [Monodon monoceros]
SAKQGAQVPGDQISYACPCGLSLRSRGGVWLKCPISGDWAGSGQLAIRVGGGRNFCPRERLSALCCARAHAELVRASPAQPQVYVPHRSHLPKSRGR